MKDRETILIMAYSELLRQIVEGFDPSLDTNPSDSQFQVTPEEEEMIIRLMLDGKA